MKILLFLISFFLKEYGGEKILPLFELLKKNSFDLKKSIANLNPEVLLLIANFFIENFGKKKSSHYDINENFGLAPIKNFADKRITSCLSSYFDG